MSQKFLERDGFLNVEAFVLLAKEIDKIAAKEQLKATEIHFVGKVIPKYDAAKAKAGGATFTKKRAQVVKMKTRMPQAGSRMRMVVLLRDYKGFSESHPEFNKSFDLALAAIESHNKLAEKTLASLKAAGAKKREADTKAFDENAEEMLDMLEDAGINGNDIAIGTSMMGKTIIIKLPNGGYVSIGKADAERFKKAKESEAATKASAKASAKKANTRTKKTTRR
jgi:hypothetical protein